MAIISPFRIGAFANSCGAGLEPGGGNRSARHRASFVGPVTAWDSCDYGATVIGALFPPVDEMWPTSTRRSYRRPFSIRRYENVGSGRPATPLAWTATTGRRTTDGTEQRRQDDRRRSAAP